MADVIKQSQFIFCNKDECYDCVKHMWKELGIQQGEKDRQEIAKAIARFGQPENSRVVIITDSSKPVAIANGQETFNVDVDALESS